MGQVEGGLSAFVPGWSIMLSHVHCLSLFNVLIGLS